MRLIILSLAALLVLIQYPLWLGKGGWLRVWDISQQVDEAHQHNQGLRERNAKLGSEVQDLREGTGAVEERARIELGMIKQDEIFVQILEPGASLLEVGKEDAGKPGAAKPAPRTAVPR